MNSIISMVVVYPDWMEIFNLRCELLAEGRADLAARLASM